MTPSDATDTFAATAWSCILSAQGRDARSAQRPRCLEYLAAIYWPPVNVFVRRLCRSDDVALELTQEYFRAFVKKNVLDQLRLEKGRFRAFLLVSVKHFLANQADYRKAARRAPKGRMLSLNMDVDSARALAGSIAAPGLPTVHIGKKTRELPHLGMKYALNCGAWPDSSFPSATRTSRTLSSGPTCDRQALHEHFQ